MNFAAFQSKLNTQYTDIVIRWNDTPTMRKALNLLYAYNYNFVCAPNLNTAQSCADLKKDMEVHFYKYMHGNAKPLLHIFYNNITNKNDLRLTCETYLRSYPQYKSKIIQTLS